MADIPARVVLDGFYPAERNAAGAYRWAMPVASVATPAGASSAYRLAITLREGPTGRVPRVVAALVNGRPLGEWALSPERRGFAVIYILTADDWARHHRPPHRPRRGRGLLPAGQPRPQQRLSPGSNGEGASSGGEAHRSPFDVLATSIER